MPVTSLYEIETLLEAVDMPVALDRTGEPRPLPPIVDRSAYRVVREALSAAESASEATVAIEYMPGGVAVQVEDDSPSPREFEELHELAAGLGGGLKAT